MGEKLLSMEEKVSQILVDLATVKTDVSWLKKLFIVIIIGAGTITGVDMTGMIT